MRSQMFSERNAEDAHSTGVGAIGGQPRARIAASCDGAEAFSMKNLKAVGIKFAYYN